MTDPIMSDKLIDRIRKNADSTISNSREARATMAQVAATEALTGQVSRVADILKLMLEQQTRANDLVAQQGTVNKGRPKDLMKR